MQIYNPNESNSDIRLYTELIYTPKIYNTEWNWVYKK
jgi:hypothetical protein